jgi:hypothetical protein
MASDCSEESAAGAVEWVHEPVDSIDREREIQRSSGIS